MPRENRKFRRAAEPRPKEGKLAKKELQRPVLQEIPPVEGLGREQFKQMGLRLGLPVLGLWVVGALIAGISQTATIRAVALGLPALITVLGLGLVLWAWRYAHRAKQVHGILRQARSEEEREAALSKLDAKKNDPTAVFAKAQLLMQKDPRQALAVLEELDLSKLLPPVADEARAQRAMIHLVLGEVSRARPLADGIDLSRHQEPKTRAMMVAVVAETWARSGQGKKALDTLSLIDPEDREYEALRPQLYRALAYAYAHTEDLRGVRRALRKLLDQDVRLLGGFFGKRTHPLLEREAKKLVLQSGRVPQKLVVQRR